MNLNTLAREAPYQTAHIACLESLPLELLVRFSYVKAGRCNDVVTFATWPIFNEAFV